MLDRGEPDAKVPAAPAEDPFQNESLEIEDLPPHVLKEIAHFFEVYKDLEGKRVQIIGWEPRRPRSRRFWNRFSGTASASAGQQLSNRVDAAVRSSLS